MHAAPAAILWLVSRPNQTCHPTPGSRAVECPRHRPGVGALYRWARAAPWQIVASNAAKGNHMRSTLGPSTAALLTLAAGFICLVLPNGCTFGPPNRIVSLHYTPLIQTRRLADRSDPQTVVVEQFVDARQQVHLARPRAAARSTLLDPLVHYEYNAGGDIPTLVRTAFVDGLAKAGFKVTGPDESVATPLFRLTGKVLAYNSDPKGFGGKRALTTNVSVEVTIRPPTGVPRTFAVQGQCMTEGEELSLESAISDSLDRALQECIKDFLAHHELLEMSSK